MKSNPKKYIALLRGINVGGKNLIKMEVLKNLFESLGFENVRTYIQSGNVLFEFAAMIKSDPFGNINPESGTTPYVTFLRDPIKKKPELPKSSPKKDVEIIEIKKREVFNLARRINGQSGFPNKYVESEFKLKATTRNWTTVCKLAELAIAG